MRRAVAPDSGIGPQGLRDAVALPVAHSVHGKGTPHPGKSQWAISDGALAFAGEFGAVDAEAWSRFERAVWPGLLRAGVRSVRLAHRREVAGLAQRLVRLRGLISSTSFPGRDGPWSRRPTSLWAYGGCRRRFGASTEPGATVRRVGCST